LLFFLSARFVKPLAQQTSPMLKRIVKVFPLRDPVDDLPEAVGASLLSLASTRVTLVYCRPGFCILNGVEFHVATAHSN
jgi:hypothetical protein